jgi:hypothetical protein
MLLMRLNGILVPISTVNGAGAGWLVAGAGASWANSVADAAKVIANKGRENIQYSISILS